MVTWLDVPAVDSLDDPQWGWAYQACARLDRLNSEARYGNGDVAQAAQVFMAERRDDVDADPFLTIGLDGPVGQPGSIIALGSATHERAANQDKAEIIVSVRPDLADSTVGDELLARLEDNARRAGRTTALLIAAFSPAEDHAPYLTTADGTTVPTGAWPVALALRHGYELGQAERRSRLDLPMDQSRHDELLVDAVAGSAAYRLQLWHGGIPAEWRQGYADLRASFMSEAPSGDIAWEDEVWDAERVARWQQTKLDAGNVPLIAAAEDPTTGRLVGVSGLTYRDDGKPVAVQSVTLVLRAHRGHHLGQWLKLVTHDALLTEAPWAERIYTENAQENQHMLAINQAMGFQPYGGSGAMVKAL